MLDVYRAKDLADIGVNRLIIILMYCVVQLISGIAVLDRVLDSAVSR